MHKLKLCWLLGLPVCLLAARVFSAELGLEGISSVVDDMDLEIACVNADGSIPLARAVTIAETRVNGLDDVGGFLGFAIVPSQFLELSVVLMAGGSQSNFVTFLQSTNPVVRAMGVVCLSLTDTNALAAYLPNLRKDTTKLQVWTGCCMPVRKTMAELVDALLRNRNYLGHQDDYWEFQQFRKRVATGNVPVRVLKVK